MSPRSLLLAALLAIAAPAHAQRTAANFLRYVDGGHYREARFHRTVTLQNQDANSVKIEVIQASAEPALTLPVRIVKIVRIVPR